MTVSPMATLHQGDEVAAEAFAMFHFLRQKALLVAMGACPQRFC